MTRVDKALRWIDETYPNVPKEEKIRLLTAFVEGVTTGLTEAEEISFRVAETYSRRTYASGAAGHE